jgi:hypothetical protein
MLRLNRPLRPTASADPDDVLAAKRVFLDLGYYDPPTGELHPWPDAPLFQAIRSFQIDNELAPDAEMLPGGPTEAALNRVERHASGAAMSRSLVFDARDPEARAGREAAAERPRDPLDEAPADGARQAPLLFPQEVAKRKGSPGRPVNLSRCLDSCEGGGELLEGFCRVLRSKAAREACWRMTNASVTACRNWCHNEFDGPERR